MSALLLDLDLDLDLDRLIALAHVPRTRRGAVEALWKFDARLGAISASSGDPALVAIKLAWWREAVEALPGGGRHADPVLVALLGNSTALALAPEIAGIEVGWAAVANGRADAEGLALHAEERGGRLFDLTARLLGEASPSLEVAAAGARWALLDLARRSARGAAHNAALAAARSRPDEPRRWPPHLRPLGMLDRLALRDVLDGLAGHPGSPSRMALMLLHRLTGC